MAERKTSKSNAKTVRKASKPALEEIADTSPPPASLQDDRPPVHDRSQEANKNQG